MKTEYNEEAMIDFIKNNPPPDFRLDKDKTSSPKLMFIIKVEGKIAEVYLSLAFVNPIIWETVIKCLSEKSLEELNSAGKIWIEMEWVKRACQHIGDKESIKLYDKFLEKCSTY